MGPYAVALLALLATALLAGCHQEPPGAPKAEVVVPAADPRAEGDAAAQRGDWTTAVARYRKALERQPDDLLLHFALGSALSQLDRREDTIEQFAWVVEHGEHGRSEVATARQWLQQVGALAPAPDQTADAPARPTEGPARPVANVPMGLLEGKTSWPGIGPDERTRLSVHLRLNGDSEATAQVRQRLNIEIGTGFTWQRVPAGRYRLLGESKGVTLWDVPVTVEPDKTVAVDLSPANASVPPAAFPPRS